MKNQLRRPETKPEQWFWWCDCTEFGTMNDMKDTICRVCYGVKK